MQRLSNRRWRESSMRQQAARECSARECSARRQGAHEVAGIRCAVLLALAVAGPASAQTEGPPPPHTDACAEDCVDGGAPEEREEIGVRRDATPADERDGGPTHSRETASPPHDDDIRPIERESAAQDPREINEEDTEPSADLPPGLPPLDDALGLLLGDENALELPEVRLLGNGRMRIEFDEGRRFRSSEASTLGASFTGRAGFEIPVGDHRARLVFGDGIRVGQPNPRVPLPLVERDVSSFLYEVSLDIGLNLFGFPVRARAGRMPVVVADGRWIGTTPFDPRGRTFDGAQLSLVPKVFNARLGAFARSSAAAALGTPLAWMLLADGGVDFEHFGLTAYAFAHRDLTTLTPVTAATLGARGRLNYAGLSAKAGADGQVGAIDLTPFSPVLQAVHGEVDVEYSVDSLGLSQLGTPFAAFHIEGTYGSTVDGKGFRAPGGDVHRFLGALDLFAPSNLAEAAVVVGLRHEFIALELSGRVFAILDPTRPVLDPNGRIVRDQLGSTERWVLTEVDGKLGLQFAPGAFLEGEAAVGLPGPALDGLTYPTVRLLAWVRFDFDLGLATTANSFAEDDDAFPPLSDEPGS